MGSVLHSLISGNSVSSLNRRATSISDGILIFLLQFAVSLISLSSTDICLFQMEFPFDLLPIDLFYKLQDQRKPKIDGITVSV